MNTPKLTKMGNMEVINSKLKPAADGIETNKT